MPMVRLGARVAASKVWHESTVALVPASPSGHVVVHLHGWPGASPATVTLDDLVRSQQTGGGCPVDALLAVGATIVYPWTGPSWGTMPASEIGAQVSALLTAIGVTPTSMAVVGGSMGALAAIAAAELLPGPVLLYVPLVDIGATWDLGGDIRASIEAAWEVTGRDALVAAAADVDPVQRDCSHLVGRTLVIAATNDPAIGYAGVEAWCDTWDLPLITTTSGHVSLDDPAVDEIALLAHLTG